MYEKLKPIANDVAAKLHADLRAQVIPKIDIDIIRRYLKEHADCPRDKRVFDQLEEMTTRRVVEMVG